MTKDIRLVPVAVALWIAMIMYVASAAMSYRVLLCSGAALVIAALLLLVYRAKQPESPQWVNVFVPVLVLGLALLIALWRATLMLDALEQSGISAASEQGMYAVVVGEVSSDPKAVSKPTASAQTTFTVTLRSISINGSASSLGNEIRVMSAQAPNDVPVYGTLVQLTGKLATTDPGQRTVAILKTSEPPHILADPTGLDAATNNLRFGLLDIVQGMSDQARGLVPGAAVGDTRALTEELSEAMKITGLTHITAVSGSHFSIIFLLINAMTWWLPRTARTLLVSLVCGGFVVLVHPSGSVLRALVMGLVVLYAITRKRQSQGIAALCVAMISLLLIDPYNARDYGFALSVLATGGLIVGSGPLARFLHRPHGSEPFIPKPIAHLLSVPIAAQLAVGPVLLLLQPYLSLYSVPANIVAAPALFPATVFGLAATLLSTLSPPLALACAHAASGATWWIATTALAFARLPGAKIPWPQGPLGIIILTAATLGICALMIWYKKCGPTWFTPRSREAQSHGWRTPLRARITASQPARTIRADHTWLRTTAIVVCVALATTLLFVLRPFWLRHIVTPSELGHQWQVAACDVSQGDAFVVRDANGNTLMFDVGQEDALLRQCLHTLNLTHIDTLFLTHFHADHVGSLNTLLETVEVARILTGPLTENNHTAHTAFGIAHTHGVPIATAGSPAALAEFGAAGMLPQAGAAPHAATEAGVVPQTGTQAGASPPDGKAVAQGTKVDSEADAEELAWSIQWPTQQEAQRLGVAQRSGTDSTNDLSLTVQVELQDGTTAMFLGDLEEPGQERFARELASTRTAEQSAQGLVKMAHHGSASQSKKLAQLLQPQVAVVGVGAKNTYGHPSAGALTLYSEVGATILTTMECGTFGVYRDSERWFVVGGCP